MGAKQGLITVLTIGNALTHYDSAKLVRYLTVSL